MPLNAQSAQINDVLQAARASAPPPTVTSMREGYAALIAAIGTTERQCKVEPIDVDGLASLLFTPSSCDDGLLVWFHGGGWVINSPEEAVNEVDRLAVAARCRCLSVGYGLAPEHPFPQPQLDGIAAAAWATQHARDLGAAPTKVAVGGDSAGGNLAAVAAQRVAGLCAQLLVYPAVDCRDEATASAPHPHGYVLDADAMAFFMAQSRGDADLHDPLISPALAGRDVLAATPPALVITAEYDPLRDEGRGYAAALRAAGVEVAELHVDDEMHLFFSMPEALDSAKRAIDVAGEFLRTQFSRR